MKQRGLIITVAVNYNIQQLKILSKSISSCLISDVCKEHGVQHFLSKDIKLLNTGSFLGYAKTLKLKKLAIWSSNS